MTPETEGRLLRFLSNLEKTEDGRRDELKGIRAAVGALGEKVDRALERIFKVEAEHGRLNGRLRHVEDRVVRVESSVDDVVETTGEHELAALQRELDARNEALAKVQSSQAHWVRYAVKTGIGLVVLVATAAVGWLARGGLP